MYVFQQPVFSYRGMIALAAEMRQNKGFTVYSLILVDLQM